MKETFRQIIRCMAANKEVKSLIEDELGYRDSSGKRNTEKQEKEISMVSSYSLSRIVINEDFRIFLPEYENVEVLIKGIQPKVFYLLYLMNDKDISFYEIKELEKYKKSMIKIYKCIYPYKAGDENRPEDVVSNFLSRKNAIYEAMTKIKKGFKGVIKDEKLLNQYLIVRRQGGRRAIPLPRHLIEIRNSRLAAIMNFRRK